MSESYELRWFGPDSLPSELREWCGRHPTVKECRYDDYFAPSAKLSVKVRARSKVELKHLLAERPWYESMALSGRTQRWAKWSIPISTPTPEEIRAHEE